MGGCEAFSIRTRTLTMRNKSAPSSPHHQQSWAGRHSSCRDSPSSGHLECLQHLLNDSWPHSVCRCTVPTLSATLLALFARTAPMVSCRHPRHAILYQQVADSNT